MWCKPSGFEECEAIYNLATSLGFGDAKRGTIGLGERFVSIGRVPMDEHPVPVPEFIFAMYEEAQRRSGTLTERFAPKPGEIGFSKEFLGILDGYEERIKALEKMQSLVEYHNRQVERLDSHMIEAEERLMKLDDTISSHKLGLEQHHNKIEGLERRKFLLDGCVENGRLMAERLVALEEHLKKEPMGNTTPSDESIIRILEDKKLSCMKVQRYAQAAMYRDAVRAIEKAVEAGR